MGKRITITFFFLILIACTHKQQAQLLNFYGVQNLNRKKINTAIETFTKIKILQSDSTIYIMYNLGLSYMQLNELDSAEKIFISLLTKDDIKIKSQSYFQLANIYFIKKEYNKSLEFFKKSIKLNSNFMEAKINYEFLLQVLDNIKEDSNTSQRTDVDINNEAAIIEFIQERELQIWEVKHEKNKKQPYHDY